MELALFVADGVGVGEEMLRASSLSALTSGEGTSPLEMSAWGAMTAGVSLWMLVVVRTKRIGTSRLLSKLLDMAVVLGAIAEASSAL